MSKLTWFKFSPSDWMMGRVQKCTPETQANFIRLCCVYWNKNGQLSTAKAIIEVGEEIFKELQDKHLIELSEDFTFIKFLDEQLNIIHEKHEKKVKAGKKAASKKSADGKQTHRSPIGHPYQTHSNDIQEKRREEEKRKEKKQFRDFWDKYPVKKSKQTAKLKSWIYNQKTVS